jgi:8-hydroxy-5-deazaflavin:NADPH oxidoreductase
LLYLGLTALKLMQYENRHYRRRRNRRHASATPDSSRSSGFSGQLARPESLADLAAETGAKAVPVEEAARFGEVVVVTIPEKNIPNLPRDLFAPTPDTVIVVDTGNYYPRQRDGRIDGIEAGLTESRWVAQQLNRPVTKAFNNIYAEHLLKLGKPKGTPGRIALSCSGR